MSLNVRTPALENGIEQNQEQSIHNTDLTNLARQVERAIGHQLDAFSGVDKVAIKAAVIQATCELGDRQSTLDFAEYNKNKGTIELRVDGCFDKHLDIKEILAARAIQLNRSADNPLPIFKQSIDLGGIHGQIEQGINGLLEDYSPKAQTLLKDALTMSCFNVNKSVDSKIEDIVIRPDNGHLEAKVDNWFYASIDPKQTLANQGMLSENDLQSDPQLEVVANTLKGSEQQPQLLKPELEPRSTIAKSGDAALHVAQRLDPENPNQALGHLYNSGQIKDIKGDNGYMIPNIRPGKEYSYDPSQYTDASKGQLDHLARNNIGRESSFNTRVDEVRDQQAAQQIAQKVAEQKAADEVATAQKLVNNVTTALKAIQQTTATQSKSVNPPKAESNSDTPWYKQAYNSVADKASYVVDYTTNAASTAYNGTVDYVSRNVIEPTVETYKEFEGELATTLRVKEGDNFVVAGLKRQTASAVSTVRGTVLFGAEAIEGIYDLGVGTVKTVGTGYIGLADAVSDGYLSQKFDFVKDANTHNAKVSEMVVGLGSKGIEVVADYQITNINHLTFNQLEKVSPFVQQATERNNMRMTKLGDGIVNYSSETIQAYIEGDFIQSSQNVKHALNVATVFVAPELLITKAGTASKFAIAADHMTDVAKGLNTVDHLTDAAKGLNTLDHISDAAKGVNTVENITDVSKVNIADHIVDTGKVAEEIKTGSFIDTGAGPLKMTIEKPVSTNTAKVETVASDTTKAGNTASDVTKVEHTVNDIAKAENNTVKATGTDDISRNIDDIADTKHIHEPETRKIPEEPLETKQLPDEIPTSTLDNIINSLDEVEDFKKLTPENQSRFKEIYRAADEAKVEIDALADSIAAKYSDAAVAKAPLKSPARALQKIIDNYRGNPEKINDLARNTIIVDQKHIYSVLDDLKGTGQLARKPFEFTPSNNTSGYSGINATIKTKSGMIAEVQINSPAMIYAKEPEKVARSILGDKVYDSLKDTLKIEGGKGHVFYEKTRVLDGDSLEAKALYNESREYYDLIRARAKGE